MLSENLKQTYKYIGEGKLHLHLLPLGISAVDSIRIALNKRLFRISFRESSSERSRLNGCHFSDNLFLYENTVRIEYSIVIYSDAEFFQIRNAISDAPNENISKTL